MPSIPTTPSNTQVLGPHPTIHICHCRILAAIPFLRRSMSLISFKVTRMIIRTCLQMGLSYSNLSAKSNLLRKSFLCCLTVPLGTSSFLLIIICQFASPVSRDSIIYSTGFWTFFLLFFCYVNIQSNWSLFIFRFKAFF